MCRVIFSVVVCFIVFYFCFTFLLSYFYFIVLFSDEKRGKSQQGGLAPSSFQTTGGVHELVARSSAWRVRAAKDRAKVGGFTTLHGFVYTTRANTSHEKAEQIRARIVCTPAEKRGAGVNLVCALTGLSK